MTDHDLMPPLDDADLRALLDRCLSDVQAPDRLPASALAAGRRLRTRRRAGQVTGGLVAAAACAAVVVVTVGGSHGTVTPGYAGDPTPTAGLSPSPDQATRDDLPSGWWDMPSRRMVTVLKDLLPDGVTVTEADRYVEGTTARTMATGSLNGVLAAPTGPGAFQVILYPPDPAEPLPEAVTSTDAQGSEVATADASSPPLSDRIRCEAYMTTCEPVLDASGAVIGRVSTDEEGGTAYYEVRLLGPDGGALYFYVADSSGEKPGYEAPSAEAPPLSTDQLLALAQDPAWTDFDPED